MSNHTPNHAFADALLALKAKGNAKAQTLVVSVHASKRAAIDAQKAAAEARQERINFLKKLVYDTRIPNLERGYKYARELGYMGGEDYDEAVRVLKFARASRGDWQTALHCFNQ